jgi:tRNA-2-methylthio-N6-dimethylallyladenosine synthase
VLLNTCAVRENADNKLYGTLGHLKRSRTSAAPRPHHRRRRLPRPEGRRTIVAEKAPWVDVVYGTHNLAGLPAAARPGRLGVRPRRRARRAARDLPVGAARQARVRHHAWVSISVGCDNTCTFCIVPSLRGPERRASSATSSTRSARSSPTASSRSPCSARTSTPTAATSPAVAVRRTCCAELRRHRRARAGPVHLAAPPRLHRGRPRGDGRDPQRLRAPAPAAAVGLGPRPAPHAPVLPRRAATSTRRAHPRAAARRGADDRHHRRVPRRDRRGLRGRPSRSSPQVRFDQAFTFQYSPRPGTPAAELVDEFVPAEVVRERYHRLEELVRASPTTPTSASSAPTRSC